MRITTRLRLQLCTKKHSFSKRSKTKILKYIQRKLPEYKLPSKYIRSKIRNNELNKFTRMDVKLSKQVDHKRRIRGNDDKLKNNSF